MEKSKMIKLAKDLLFEPKEEVFSMLDKEHEQIKKQLELLQKFDLTNVEPMNHINEQPISFEMLREDKPKPGLEKQKLLANAFLHDDEFVIMRKVINDK